MKCYAVKHKNESIIDASRSGGFFTALSDVVFENGGVVYGCVMETPYKATHIRTDNKNNRDLMRGSKYIQSQLKDVFCSVKKDVECGTLVLFSGVPCQIAGLKNYLKKNYTNLICVDLLCHGVPSQLVWERYIKWQEQRHGATAVSVDFRDKKNVGWADHIESIKFDDGFYLTSKVFTNIFYSHVSLRPSCYCCPFKSLTRTGDLSIGDYWGIEKAAPKFNDDKGVSLVLVNTEKGEKYFELSQKDINWQYTLIEYSMQNALRHAYSKPDSREAFWDSFKNKDFSFIAKKYSGDVPKMQRIRERVKRFLKKIVRR